jgi:hypothetical protein
MSKMFQWVIAILLLALVAVNVWLVCTIRCHGAMCNMQKPMGGNMITTSGAVQKGPHTFNDNLTNMYINSWKSTAAIRQSQKFTFKDDLMGTGPLPLSDTTVWICAAIWNVQPMPAMFNKENDSITVISSIGSYPDSTTFIYWIQ